MNNKLIKDIVPHIESAMQSLSEVHTAVTDEHKVKAAVRDLKAALNKIKKEEDAEAKDFAQVLDSQTKLDEHIKEQR